MSASNTLDIALLHLGIEPKAPSRNRQELVRMAEQAADGGASIIVAPELAVSGYLTECRAKVSPFVEDLDDETASLLAEVARRRAVYLCAGFAERDSRTDIYYNSALVFGPSGAVVAHHRKVLCERRWASPGCVTDKSRFDTQWGRVGLLICADTYSSLLPRTQALHGVDLLLVLANWPDCGLDPRELWRARALENGFGVVVCNRTGADTTLDFSPAHSYAVTGGGAALADLAAPESAICHVHYPLQDGVLASAPRDTILERRSPEAYAALSLNVNGLAGFSGMWGLPEAGKLVVECVASAERLPVSAGKGDLPRVIIAPPGGTALDHAQVSALTGSGPIAVVATVRTGESGCPVYGLYANNALVALSADRPATMVDFGPARIALAWPEALRHPELSVALSKQGCDLVVAATAGTLSQDDRLVLGVKSLDRLALAMVGANGASICVPPLGHGRWEEETLDASGKCRREIDTAVMRRKYFEDRVDLPVLLRL
jgi:predicted amidohydrolase